MPWIVNDNGVSEYKLSIYTKEELPTWDEIYNEFYQKFGATFYDPENKFHTELDHYWKIPRYKYLLAIVCNQFNKMIWEDSYNESLISFIKENIEKDAIGVRFYLGDAERINDSKIDMLPFNPLDKDPLIYTIPFPNGMKNPFIPQNGIMNRCIITDPGFHKNDEKLHLVPLIYLNDWKPDFKRSIAINDSTTQYHEIIEFMMKPFESYFENGIGWEEDTLLQAT